MERLIPSERRLDLSRTFARGLARQATTVGEAILSTCEKLDLAEPPSPGFDRYWRSMRTARDDLWRLCVSGRVAFSDVGSPRWGECIARIAPSYIHMMNNRLGVSIVEEVYLAELIERTLLTVSES